MPAAVQPFVPFQAEFADALWEVVRRDDPGTAKAVYDRMTDPQRLAYSASDDRDDRAIAVEWHQLHNDVRSVANGRTNGLQNLRRHFESYWAIQVDRAQIVGRKHKAEAALEYDDRSSPDNAELLAGSIDNLVLALSEGSLTSEEMLHRRQPPSELAPTIHWLTRDVHYQAEDKALTSLEAAAELTQQTGQHL